MPKIKSTETEVVGPLRIDRDVMSVVRDHAVRDDRTYIYVINNVLREWAEKKLNKK